jgi:CBS domain-containing protein
MRVRDVMRKEVRTIKPSEPASLAKELFRRYDIHHLVVVDQKNVIGMVADRDLMDVGGDTPVQRAMAHPPVTITPDETVRKAAALMAGHVIGSLPVVDDGKLVGIVTTYDLVALLAKGATRPAPAGVRPILSKRGPRMKPVVTGRTRR